MFIVRTVNVNGKKVQKIFVEKKKQKQVSIKTCPKQQIVKPWKKYKNNKYRATDGKLFKTKKEMTTYNRMYTPKIEI